MAASSTIEKQWFECLALWTPSGRVEDFPRNVRAPKYAPSEATLAGREFARTHRDSYSFLVARVAAGDAFERLCAFECLEYMCWEFGIGAVPKEILAISDPIPPVILAELAGDAESEGFMGKTIGAWFTHVFSVGA